MAVVQNRYYVITPPGLELICAGELARLGIPGSVSRGGVEFAGGLRELYLANLWLRSASRVLVRLGELKARDFPTLYKRLVRLPWGRFIKPGTHCEVRVTCHRSRLNHSGRIAETVQTAVAKALGESSAGTGAAQRIFLRLEDDCCQLSVDSSGELLHRRGYRQASVTAPLRENLAAGALLLLGYDGSRPLIDGMTGSGTFAIEAALIALNRAPGRARQFAFMHWPKYRQSLWEQLCLRAKAQENVPDELQIVAVDSNPLAIEAAQQNAKAAGVASLVSLRQQQMQELQPGPRRGLIICNPPYGERIGRTAALRSLYRSLGQLYLQEFSDWQGALVCPDAELSRATGIDFAPVAGFSNGGIRVSLLKKP